MLMMWEMGICCFSVIVGLSMAQCISAEPWVVYLLWAVVILTFFHLFCSSSVVSWKVLPGILQKHCCILPDRNAGKDLTDVPLSTNDTTHTQCWDGKREPVCESNEQAVIPGNGDSVGGSYLSACSTSRSWPCFSHSVDLPWPHCLATNCSLYPSYIKLFFSHLTATPSNINMCQIWWGSLCVLTFSTYMPEGREKLGSSCWNVWWWWASSHRCRCEEVADEIEEQGDILRYLAAAFTIMTFLLPLCAFFPSTAPRLHAHASH